VNGRRGQELRTFKEGDPEACAGWENHPSRGAVGKKHLARDLVKASRAGPQRGK